LANLRYLPDAPPNSGRRVCPQGSGSKENKISVGVEEAGRGYERFINAWNNAEGSDDPRSEVHLNVEDFAMLAAVLTPKRLDLLKVLRREGPMSVRSLSKVLGRDYQNVHVDSFELGKVGSIQRDHESRVAAPWDVIDAHFRLVA